MSAGPVTRLLDDLRRWQVTLVADGDELRCSAPAGVLTDDLVAELRTHKRDLLAALRDDRRIPRTAGGPGMLSYAQERMWLQTVLRPGDCAYNLPLRIDLAGPLRPVALRLALAEVVRRHEVLRTRYPTSRGRPVPVVEPHATPPMPLVDLRALAPTARRRTLRALETVEARRLFDLTTGPVLRSTLVRLAPYRHTLLITRHHIASDGWSLGVLMNELGEAYDALTARRRHRLPELPIQYGDFGAWQRSPARESGWEDGLSRWVRRLRDAPSGLDLLADAPPEPATGYAQSIRFTVPEQDVTRLGAALRTSAFTVLASAFGWALCGVGGQHDIVVGCAVAGRTRAETELLIGPFASMLPLRLDLAGRPSFRELTRRTHDAVQAMLDDQDVPVERLVEALRPQRVLSDNPLFAVAFAMQNTPRPTVQVPGLRAWLAPSPPVAPKFALAMTATPRGGNLDLELEFDPARVTAALAARILAATGTALAAGIAHPDRPAPTGPPPAAAAEAAPPASVREAGATCPYRLVEDVAADAIAITYQGAQLSYGALNARSNRLATALRARGAGPEVLVGLCLEPSLDLVVAVLGIVKSGAAYLPIDPEDPPRRRAQICADAAVRLAVTRRGLLDADVDRVFVDVPEQWRRRVAPDRRRPPVTPDNIAYAIHTSGSTGDPKGVLVTHANLAGLLAGARVSLPVLAATQVWAMTHSPAFDVSVFEMWGALTTGARLVVAPAGLRRTPDEMWRHLVEERVTVLSQTPSALGQLTPVALESGTTGALRAVLLAGEPCDPARFGSWLTAGPALVNLYGITETSVHTTTRILTTADVAPSAGRSGTPIGRPIPGQLVAVLGHRGEPLPAGGKGELSVGGAGVARGYLSRPGLTAARFRPAGVGGRPGGRWYRSGDLARVLPDGELSHAGRVDDQIKLRGHRIEPGEIETALSAYPGVSAAAVVRCSAAQRDYLVGYVVPVDPGAPPDEAHLRRHLADQLPRYLVPARLVAIDALPLTRNGKVDRSALARRSLPALGPAAEDRPRTRTERILVGILAELLGYASAESIGIRDNLFDLGGDSLVVTQFHARIVEEFLVDAPVRRIYQALDVGSLAATVDELLAEREREAIRSALAEVAGAVEEDR